MGLGFIKGGRFVGGVGVGVGWILVGICKVGMGR